MPITLKRFKMNVDYLNILVFTMKEKSFMKDEREKEMPQGRQMAYLNDKNCSCKSIS